MERIKLPTHQRAVSGAWWPFSEVHSPSLTGLPDANRAVLDRPVVDRTGLSGKYDFDLEWMPDEVQFGGHVPPGTPEAQQKPDLFAAIQQLGLRLDATKGPVEVLVINQVQRPTAN